jgi:hypothetical protein
MAAALVPETTHLGLVITAANHVRAALFARPPPRPPSIRSPTGGSAWNIVTSGTDGHGGAGVRHSSDQARRPVRHGRRFHGGRLQALGGLLGARRSVRDKAGVFADPKQGAPDRPRRDRSSLRTGWGQRGHRRRREPRSCSRRGARGGAGASAPHTASASSSRARGSSRFAATRRPCVREATDGRSGSAVAEVPRRCHGGRGPDARSRPAEARGESSRRRHRRSRSPPTPGSRALTSLPMTRPPRWRSSTRR